MKFASWMNAETKFGTAPKVLMFRGPSATSGYYRNPRHRSAAAAGPATHRGIRVGGLGRPRYRADGEIYVTGRVKDIIIKGGRNLYPHEVEELAARIDGIARDYRRFRLGRTKPRTEKLSSSRRPANGDATTARISRFCRDRPCGGEDWTSAGSRELIPRQHPENFGGKLRREKPGSFIAGIFRLPAPLAAITRWEPGAPAHLRHEISCRCKARARDLVKKRVYGAVMFCFGSFRPGDRAIHQGSQESGTLHLFRSKRLSRRWCDVRVVGKEYMDNAGAKSTRRITQVISTCCSDAGAGRALSLRGKMEVGRDALPSDTVLEADGPSQV